MDWYSFILNEVFVGLVEMLFGFNVNIGGQISIGEMIIAVWFVFNFQKFSQIPNYRQYLVMYLCLIGAQIFSEIFVSSGFNNSLRGILVSVFSLIHFSFLLFYFHKKPQTIVATLIGAALSIAVFRNLGDVDADSLLAGEDVGMLKMRIAPMLSYLVVAASTYLDKKFLTPMFIYMGLMIIVLGARNAGLALLVTGVLGFFASTEREISKQYIYGTAFLICIIGVIAYIFYVDSVLSGKISSGNNYVLLEMDNPYNPIELLKYSRSQTFVGFQAFMDKFWLGHGNWTTDHDNYYHAMVTELHHVPFRRLKESVIPVHSVIVGWGTFNGIVAFTCGVRLILSIIWQGIMSLKQREYTGKRYFNNPYAFCVAFSLFSIVWNGVFSPVSHFRLTIPIYMAIVAYCFARRSFKQLDPESTKVDVM